MKKISAVLLVLVLVGSVAFAGFTGSATTTFGVNLDDGSWGFKNATAVDVDLVFFEQLAGKKGEGEIYAEINAKLALSFDSIVPQDGDLNFVELDVYLKDYLAKIYGDNWYVSILGAKAAPNFASSAVDFDGNDDPEDIDPSNFVGKNEGIEVGFNDYVFGLSIDKDLNNFKASPMTYNFFGSVVTPEFEVADGLKLTFGGAGLIADTGKAVSASAKGSFETEDYSASLAADFVYDGGPIAEAAVNVAIDPVTLDVYYATEGGGVVYLPTVKNILSAKAAFAIDKFDIAVTGLDLINTTELGATVDFAATDEIAVGVNGGYTLTGGAWYVGGDVKYTAEDFVVTADATYASAGTLKVNAKIESKTLVDGATLSLGYANADILANLGAVTATAKIAF
ncbi:MAG: hypothetical protein PHP38_03365 [Sphaerochaetaceae bacterium]|nr:hypothetical protein [Sphaerochaetaceae bacterium]